MNPLHLLDSVLADWVSPRVRRAIHALIMLAVALVAIWMAVDGDWVEMIIAIATTLYAASNTANTPPADYDDPRYEEASDVPLDEPLFDTEDGLGR